VTKQCISHLKTRNRTEVAEIREAERRLPNQRGSWDKDCHEEGFPLKLKTQEKTSTTLLRSKRHRNCNQDNSNLLRQHVNQWLVIAYVYQKERKRDNSVRRQGVWLLQSAPNCTVTMDTDKIQPERNTASCDHIKSWKRIM